MRVQSPEFSKLKELKFSNRLLADLSRPRLSGYTAKYQQLAAFAKAHRIAIIICTLSLLLVWQWHVARMATLRADIAERDMELNARQALQLSEAVLKAQSSRERLERKISGYALPEPR